MPTQINATILDFLKLNGPQSEAEIADALKISVSQIHAHVEQLSSVGDIICCSLTQFKEGKKVEGLSCRLSCYTPPAARGRKPGVKQNSGLESLPD